MTAVERFEDDEVEPPLAMPAVGLDPAAVLVRTLSLPTSSPRKAAQAVRLQLDRLSPAPEAEVFYELAPLGEAGAPGGTLWAVAFARRAEVIRACEALGRPSVSVEKMVAGRLALFHFKSPGGGFAAGATLTKWAAPAAAIGLAVAMLMAAIDVRIREDLAVATAAGLGSDADQAWRLASDRDVAVRSWMAMTGDRADRITLCAARLVADRAPGRHALVSVIAGPGEATLTFVGTLAPELARVTGVTVTSDGEGQRQAVRVTAAACGKGGS